MTAIITQSEVYAGTRGKTDRVLLVQLKADFPLGKIRPFFLLPACVCLERIGRTLWCIAAYMGICMGHGLPPGKPKMSGDVLQ